MMRTSKVIVLVSAFVAKTNWCLRLGRPGRFADDLAMAALAQASLSHLLESIADSASLQSSTDPDNAALKGPTSATPW